MTITTVHADLRARKRLKVQDIRDDFEAALANGTSIYDFKGQFGKYLRSSAWRHKSPGVVYKNRVYWYRYSDKRLITLYQLNVKWHKYTKQHSK